MRKNVKSFFNKKLVTAITTGLLLGSCAGAFAAEYNQGLTGKDADNKFLPEGTLTIVSAETGKNITYNFTGDNSFSVENSAAISLPKAAYGKTNTVLINTNGGTLHLKSQGNEYAVAQGISVTDGTNLTLNGNVDLDIHTDNYSAQGISISRAGTGNGKEAHIVINGDVTMRNDDPENPWGLTSGNLHGGYGPGGTAPGADNYTGARWAPSGITVSSTDGSSIDINGDVDLAVRGSAVKTDPYYKVEGKDQYDLAVINLNKGNIRIETPEDQTETFYSLANYGGTINVNMAGADIAGNHDVNIKGNVIVMRDDGNPSNTMFFRDGRINLALTTANSSWTGIIDNSGSNQAGEMNLYLQNNAVWDHKSLSEKDGMQVGNMPSPSNQIYGKYDGVSHVTSLTGGDKVSSAGNIYQNDSAKLKIENYKGYTNIFYDHENSGESTSDYKAGDTVIGKASVNSGISLITSNKGITMTDSDQVNRVLNALAGKLVYEGYTQGEKNLKGKVMIADGLTASSQTLVKGDIAFGSDGRGTSEGVKGDGSQTVVDFKTAITGDKATDKEYEKGGVLKDDGSYVFQKDSKITIAENGTAAIDVQKDVVINAEGSILDLNVTGGKYGISKDNAAKADITADEININVAPVKGRAEGIHLFSTTDKNDMTINGDVNINVVSSKDYALGAYVAGNSELTINGNVTMVGEDGSWGVSNGMDKQNSMIGHYEVVGLYAGSNMGPDGAQGGKINVNGNVNLKINGTGVLANGGGSVVNIAQGGTIKINKDNVNEHYAVAAESGTVNINVNQTKDGYKAANNKVVIEGNIGVLNGALHPNEKVKDSTVNLALTTKDSAWTGVIVNNYTPEQMQEGIAAVNLTLLNGAVWNNEKFGTTSEDFSGSVVENFVGADSIAHAGYIVQKDADKLTFNNYSGAAIVAYEHENSGFDVTDYKAGNTVIKNAAADSTIRLATDGTNIKRDSSEEVNKVLTALAQKLEYKGAATEGNLKAEVSIADGLTASSVSQVGNIVFDENGVGKFDTDKGYHEETTPGGGGDCGCDYLTGNFETDIMKGARSAMMTSMMAWRDNASQLYNRAAAIKDGSEKGVWARAYGGKVKYDGNTNIENSYWAGQVGYDRVLKHNWIVGAAVDYMDGDASYLNGGQGDNLMYSFGVYGSKDLGNNQYLDIAVKAGRVENEYSVYNIIGQELKGDYASRGYSVSAQYSKVYGDRENGYFEPQLQFTWAHIDGTNYNTYCNEQAMNIDQDAFDSFVGRIGIKAGVEKDNGSFFAKLSLAHEFAGDVEGTYNAGDGGAKATSYDMGDTWSELTLGANYNLSKSSNFYADITRSLSGDYQHEWKLNAGINFSF